MAENSSSKEPNNPGFDKSLILNTQSLLRGGSETDDPLRSITVGFIRSKSNEAGLKAVDPETGEPPIDPITHKPLVVTIDECIKSYRIRNEDPPPKLYDLARKQRRAIAAYYESEKAG